MHQEKQKKESMLEVKISIPNQKGVYTTCTIEIMTTEEYYQFLENVEGCLINIETREL